MRIIICDMEIGGHHCTYLFLFATAFRDLGYNVLVLSPGDSEMIFGKAVTVPNGIEVKLVNDFPEQPIQHGFFATRNYVISLWKHLSDKLKGLNVKPDKDLVFFASLDEYLSAYIPVGLINHLLPFAWAGLYLKPRYIRVKQSYSFIRKGILSLHHLLRSSHCIGFYLLDEGIVDAMKQVSGNKNVYHLPDIIDETEPTLHFSEINAIREKANGRKIILLIGAIDKRKNTVNFLRAAQQSEKSNYFFVLAGLISLNSFGPEDAGFIQGCMDAPFENLYFHNNRIRTESEFNALVCISDVLFAAYLDFPYSSNMIAKSSVFKKPIIVSDEFLMGEMVNQYSLGITINPRNYQNIIDAIDQIMASNFTEKAKYQKFAEKHSREIFKNRLYQITKKTEPVFKG